MGDVYGEPMHAVGRSATQVSGRDADSGVGNGMRLPQVGVIEMQIGEQPDFMSANPLGELWAETMAVDSPVSAGSAP